GQPITIYGTGQQTRSFCYVSDLVTALIALMDSPAELVGPVNLGNPREFTIRGLADLVLAKVGGPSALQTRPRPADDPPQRRPDIGLARSRLGWNPDVELEEGLDRTIAYFRDHLAAGAPRGG